MIHVVVMKCLIGLPLLMHIELLWRSRSRSFKNGGVRVGVLKTEKSEVLCTEYTALPSIVFFYSWFMQRSRHPGSSVSTVTTQRTEGRTEESGSNFRQLTRLHPLRVHNGFTAQSMYNRVKQPERNTDLTSIQYSGSQWVELYSHSFIVARHGVVLN
jgi:hypothetical protein